MNVFATPDTIDNSGYHDSEINEDAAHAHKALKGGVHGAGDKFSHTVLLKKYDGSSEITFRNTPCSFISNKKSSQWTKNG